MISRDVVRAVIAPSVHLRTLLKLSGMTQREFAKELKINERTVIRYCAKDGRPPKVILLCATAFYHKRYVSKYVRKKLSSDAHGCVG